MIYLDSFHFLEQNYVLSRVQLPSYFNISQKIDLDKKKFNIFHSTIVSQCKLTADRNKALLMVTMELRCCPFLCISLYCLYGDQTFNFFFCWTAGFIRNLKQFHFSFLFYLLLISLRIHITLFLLTWI